MRIKTLLAAVICAVTVFTGNIYSQTTTVDAIQVNGLKSEVTVRRDARSIPYIEASGLEDLYFAQGFETARDRLFQMDMMRRVARGRLSEIFGKSQMADDIRYRKFGFSSAAEESLRQMSPKLRSALENYAKGVNAYIATLDENSLPAEFQLLKYRPEKWIPEDTIVLGKILADALSTSWWQDLYNVNLKKALPKEKYESLINTTTPDDVVLFGKDVAKTSRNSKDDQKRADFQFTPATEELIAEDQMVRQRTLSKTGLYAEDLAASNNWVISGSRTSDGKAILANDPHLRATAPGIWYLTHLSAPGMRVSGVTIPGVPGIILGHNEHFAWGATNVGPDVQDLYFEEFNDRGEYRTPDGWKKATVRKEKIAYRANPLVPETVDEEIEVLETRNGVVFQEIDGKKVSLNWTALNPSNQEFEAFMLLNTANDWKGFRSSLREYGGATQNFVYADTQGNIGWQVAGKIPLRKKGDGSEPYDGTTSDGDWTGYIDLDELPFLYNPPSGFIVTANQRIAGTDYKYGQLTRQVAGPWRSRRIFDLIEANPKITINDVNDIQHDVYNIPLRRFVDEIVKRETGPDEVTAMLRGWDGKMSPDSNAAVLANSINVCVGDEVAASNPPANAWQLRQFVLPYAIPAEEKLWLPDNYKNWDGLLKSCSIKSWESLLLVKSLGESPKEWKWGSYSKASFLHPLAVAPLIGSRYKVEFENVGGNGQTPNVGASVSMRHIAKPANWDETRHVIPLGQSGNPLSPHWNDQFDSWRTGKPALFPFSENAVKEAAVNVLTLQPGQ